MALRNNFFNFDGKMYKQTGEVVTGLTLAKVFLCIHEQICLKDCPEDYKPVY